MSTADEMMVIVSEGDVEKVRAMLKEAPFLIRARDGAGRTPLSVAAWCGHAHIAELLIDCGAEVNVCDRYGWTPLREAEASERLSVADLLRRRGARE